MDAVRSILLLRRFHRLSFVGRFGFLVGQSDAVRQLPAVEDAR